MYNLCMYVYSFHLTAYVCIPEMTVKFTLPLGLTLSRQMDGFVKVTDVEFSQNRWHIKPCFYCNCCCSPSEEMK